ncbi:MAG: TlpA family protein disulfide reductase [Myxococcota bacterium]
MALTLLAATTIASGCGATARARVPWSSARQWIAPTDGTSPGHAAAAGAPIDDEQARWLATRLDEGRPVEPLELDEREFQPVLLDPAASGKVTVLVFFATWCPHCRIEMPRLVRFAASLVAQPELAANVQIIGVRTSVEREREPFEDFVAAFQPSFPIYTDPTMSLAFVRFARALGIQPLLPATVVLDRGGVVRYVLPKGDLTDVEKLLGWAVKDLANKP